MSKEYENESLLETESASEGSSEQWQYRPRQRKWSCTSVLLAISLILNLFTTFAVVTILRRPEQGQSDRKPTYYAGLEEEAITVDWNQESEFTSSNNSVADAAWDAINHDSGIVAVDKEWAKEKGLPTGSTFPWDQSKAIYFVNAYHGLHCLKNIYRSQMEYREGKPQSLEYHHITHCLDQLKADVMCNADDTLRRTTPDMRPVTADGQQRQCRDWHALHQWTWDHPGCYRYGDPNVEDKKESQVPRMRYCPEGSSELQRVREYFGKGSDWKPADEPVWSWFDEE